MAVRPPGAIEAWERAYATYRRGGQDEPAAHVAVLLSREHFEGMGNDALANGWLARARDLLDGYPDSIEWGWVALVESAQAVDPTSALEHAEQALAVARQTRDSDLELAALGRAGLAEIALGRIEAGVTRFDEGMAASAAGEAADLRTLGDLYCAANLAAEITLDMSRFEQWTGVVMGFMERTGHPDLLTFCGTCCAEVCRAAGRWEDGEGWLTRTLSQLERSGQKARCVHPATRLASFRVAQGRLEEADQLLRGYEDLPEAVQAMVALHLARGQTALAAARLHRRLNEIGRDNLVTVPLLAQLVEVQLAQPDLGGAAETAEALAAIAARSGHVRAQAEAELALGSVWAVSTWTAVWDCSYGSGCRMPRVGCTSRWPGPWPKPTRTRRPPSPIGTSPPTRPSRNPRFQLGISRSSDPCASLPCHARLGCHQRRRGTWPRRMSSGTDAGRRGGTRSYDSRGPAERRPRSSTTCWRPPEPPGVGRPAAARDHPAAHPDGATRPGGRRVEFLSTGSDGKVARWSDRSVVTEATHPEVFEFVTDGRRQGNPGRRPWLATAVHRYVIAPEAGGCHVTYTEDLTRLDGAPWILRTPGVSRIVFRVSAKYMRRGFDGLLALAEERAGTSRSTDESAKR